MTEQTPTSETHRFSFRRFLRIVIAVVLIVLALIFVFSNMESTTFVYLGLIITMPAWLWFLSLLALGIVVGSIFPWGRRKHSD